MAARRDILAALPSDLPVAETVAQLPGGFRAGSISAGIKSSGKPDLSIVASTRGPLPVAATFTANRFASAPVLLDRAHLAATDPDGGGGYGWVTGLLANSGCANAATGEAGLADQRALAEALGTALGSNAEHILAVATGMIGPRLPLERMLPAIASLVAGGLSTDDAALAAVAEALRTTDSRAKWATVRLELPAPDGHLVPVTVSGVAKGVGMIHPRMATMLSYVLTDAAAEPATLHAMLRPVVARTWDQLSVDGDTSTSDTVFLVASGASGAATVTAGSPDGEALRRAIEAVARSLARQQAADGEGATALITCQVSGARDRAEARAAARAVVRSSLLKAAVHGHDPNWGRIADALGNAQLADAAVLEAAGLDAAEAARRGGSLLDLDPGRVSIAICGTLVFAGLPVAFDKAAVSRAMATPEVLIRIDLGEGDGDGHGEGDGHGLGAGSGEGEGEAFGCDLSEQYVIENAEYST